MSNMTDALVFLRQQSVACGMDGRLADFDIALCEDNKTVAVWAFFARDLPLMASFELPEPIDPATFDPAPYYGEAVRFAVGAHPSLQGDEDSGTSERA